MQRERLELLCFMDFVAVLLEITLTVTSAPLTVEALQSQRRRAKREENRNATPFQNKGIRFVLAKQKKMFDLVEVPSAWWPVIK